MSDDRRKSFWIGIFVLGAFVLLGALVVMFGSLPSMFQARERYTVKFNDAPGIGPGTPVRRSGVRVGEVESVRLEEDGIVVVRLGVTPTFRPRKSDKPTLYTGLIGGDASIDFIPAEQEPGKPAPDRTPLEPGAEIQGVRGPNVGSLINRASEVVPTTQETMADIRKSMQRLEKSAPLIDNALREVADLGKAVREAIPDTRRTLDEVRELAKSVREAVPDVREISKDLSRITRDVREAMPEVRETNKQFQKLLRSVDEVVPDAQKLMRTLNEAAPDARKAMAEGAEFLKAVREEIPELRKTNTEAREFLKALREAIPDARKAIDQGRELFKSVQEAIPDARQTLEDVGAAARRATRLGEQLSTLITENRDKVVTALDRFNKLLEDAGKVAERVGNLLSEENQRNFNEIIRSFRDTVNKGPDLVRNLDTVINDLRASLKKLDPVLDSAAKALAPLAETVDKILRPLVDRAPNLARNIDETVGHANAILKDVRTMIRVVGESDGTLNRILTDPRLFNRIDAILCDVQKLTPKFELIVRDIGVFADKLARHPELIGVGGAVHGSDGLKNPPTIPGTVIRPGP
jgi:ABC-type transporter Mla subunit MlaD